MKVPSAAGLPLSGGRSGGRDGQAKPCGGGNASSQGLGGKFAAQYLWPWWAPHDLAERAPPDLHESSIKQGVAQGPANQCHLPPPRHPDPHASLDKPANPRLCRRDSGECRCLNDCD